MACVARMPAAARVTADEFVSDRGRPVGYQQRPIYGRLHVTMPVKRHAKAARRTKSKMRGRPKSSAEKVRAHRARLREAGLRPVQIWIPDTRSREFAREARRQSLAVARSPGEKEDQAFLDAISEWPDNWTDK